MATEICPSCGKSRGSNAACLSCRDAAARELANAARDVTDDAMKSRAEALRQFADAPPWYARLAPKKLMKRLGLLGLLLEDYARGRYRKIPWRSIAVVTGAVAYVISPIDLIPDFLVPIGWTDDMLVLALAWMVVKSELRDYCVWKGLSPAEYDI